MLFGVCGEPGPPREALVPPAVEGRRRRLSPTTTTRLSSSASSSPSSLVGPWPPTGGPGMERPPGRFAVELAPGMVMEPAKFGRGIAAPTGMLGGMFPGVELRQAWMRFFPSGWVTRGCSLAVVKV